MFELVIGKKVTADGIVPRFHVTTCHSSFQNLAVQGLWAVNRDAHNINFLSTTFNDMHLGADRIVLIANVWESIAINKSVSDSGPRRHNSIQQSLLVFTGSECLSIVAISGSDIECRKSPRAIWFDGASCMDMNNGYTSYPPHFHGGWLNCLILMWTNSCVARTFY